MTFQVPLLAGQFEITVHDETEIVDTRSLNGASIIAELDPNGQLANLIRTLSKLEKNESVEITHGRRDSPLVVLVRYRNNQQPLARISWYLWLGPSYLYRLASTLWA